MTFADTACTVHEDESTMFPDRASSVVTVIWLLGEVVGGDLIPVKLSSKLYPVAIAEPNAASMPIELVRAPFKILQEKLAAREAPETLEQTVVEYMTGLYVADTEFSQVVGNVRVKLLSCGRPFPTVMAKVATVSVWVTDGAKERVQPILDGLVTL